MDATETIAFERSLHRIVDLAKQFGLDFFPMRYEICPADVLYTFGAYGMPTRFAHWSFGKAYYRMKMQYDLNLSRIYELVVNSDPCYAFLLDSNSLLQNKMIAAHVLAHSDFFKNNRRFSHTSRDMMDVMAANAARIRDYEFRFGREPVERLLDAALALQYHVDPHAVRQPPPRRPPEGDRPRGAPDAAIPYEDLWSLEARPSSEERRDLEERKATEGRKAAAREPSDPTKAVLDRWQQVRREDLLRFIAEEARHLEDWERHILLMVRDEMLYFFPQLETKIMNEGWASFWHARMMRSLDLSPEEAVDFAKMHAHVLQPNPMSINPYRVGYAIFADIEKRWNTDKMFEVREMDDDASFLRNYLTEELVASLDLYLYARMDDAWVVTTTEWEAVRDHLARQMSHMGIPRITVADDDYRGSGELLLWHHFEGDELDQRYVDHTLPHVHHLWRRPVHLDTVVNGHPTLISYDGRIQRRRSDAPPP